MSRQYLSSNSLDRWPKDARNILSECLTTHDAVNGHLARGNLRRVFCSRWINSTSKAQKMVATGGGGLPHRAVAGPECPSICQ